MDSDRGRLARIAADVRKEIESWPEEVRERVRAELATKSYACGGVKPKPAPAPGADAAIEALLPDDRYVVRIMRSAGGFVVYLDHYGDVLTYERAPTLSAALAALRGEGK